MASRTARSVDRTVDKMLRQMAKSSNMTAVANDSASSAAQALQRMAEIQKRIARGDKDAARLVSAKVAESQAAADPSLAAAPSGTDTRTTASGSKVTYAVIASVAAAVLVAAIVGFSASGSNHSVSGTVLLDREPLSNVEVAFFAKSGSREPIRAVTTDRGTFNIASVPAGDYAIFLSPNGNTATKVPKRYLTPESTPFRLSLTKDRSDLRMIASSGKRN